jgi:hypothetical protein
MAIEAKKSGQSYSPACAKKVSSKYMTRGIKPRHRPQRPREPGAVAMGPGLLFEGLHFSFIHAADEQIHCCTTAKRGARS